MSTRHVFATVLLAFVSISLQDRSASNVAAQGFRVATDEAIADQQLSQAIVMRDLSTLSPELLQRTREMAWKQISDDATPENWNEHASRVDAFILSGSYTQTATLEAYINEDEEHRKGIFLFLDKAFDRVSYDFTLRGLQATGYGKRFRKWVELMYDTAKPPRRRIYANGYYSEWFEIKSGVAQGCPLSPLLFLEESMEHTKFLCDP